jgi:hypothetical protein
MSDPLRDMLLVALRAARNGVAPARRSLNLTQTAIGRRALGLGSGDGTA